MKHKIIPYDKKLKQFSRNLRSNMTQAEVVLWAKIRRKQILGFQFNRQKPIDKFIVDFYCKPLKLAIEVDGSSHDSVESQEYDLFRQRKLEDLGVSFLRFRNKEVLNDIENVIRVIENWITEFEEKLQ